MVTSTFAPLWRVSSPSSETSNRASMVGDKHKKSWLHWTKVHHSISYRDASHQMLPRIPFIISSLWSMSLQSRGVSLFVQPKVIDPKILKMLDGKPCAATAVTVLLSMVMNHFLPMHLEGSTSPHSHKAIFITLAGSDAWLKFFTQWVISRFHLIIWISWSCIVK